MKLKNLIRILLFSLLFMLSGCALLTPPSENELRRWVMTEDGIDGKITSENFWQNHVVNETSGRFVICTKEGQQLRVWATLSRSDGFRIFKSGTGVPCKPPNKAAKTPQAKIKNIKILPAALFFIKQVISLAYVKTGEF